MTGQHHPDLIRLGEGEGATRLFCLPYAGGSAQVFADWTRELSPKVEVWALQLPGRGARLREPPLSSMDEMAALVVDALAGMTDLPFALFGHSMGALVAFESLRGLREPGVERLGRLYVSACAAPPVAESAPPLHELPDEALLHTLETVGGLSAEFDARSPLGRILLTSLRADLEAYGTYAYEAGPKLHCPIVAFAGCDDQMVSRADVERWSEQTTGGFSLHNLPGSHFAWKDHSQPLLQFLDADLAQLTCA